MEFLKADYVDGVIVTISTARGFIEKNNCCSYKIIEEIKDGVSCGVKKNSPLLPEINKALDNLKEQGVIKKLEEKWFGEIDLSEENWLK
jgi:ABC-type amino acid transport substrate-binding protein